MKPHKTAKLFGLLIMVAGACLPLFAGDGNFGTKTGQSVTLLPDGSTLLLGGFETSGRPSSTAVLRDSSGRDQTLASLQTARAGHTATVLPDGTVFIFGGLGADGKIVSTAELFDPATQVFTVLSDVLAVPRAFHTATVLTDGTLLLAGGIEAAGEFPDDVQLWDFRTHHALSQHALLMTPRQGHRAVLLSDGAIRISGGTDHFGRPVVVDEIYDPATRRFRFSTSDEMSAQLERESQIGPQVADSMPADGASDVPVDSMIGIRFTRLLNVTQVNAAEFVLRGPNGVLIPAKVSAAENGRLAFVLPSAPLQPGTTYSLQIRNTADAAGNLLAEASISFTTAGEPPETEETDDSSTSTTSRFQGLPPLQAAPGQTALAGQVLKLNGWPLEQVTLEMDGHKARTDSSGRFLLKDLAPGHHVLWIDGGTANRSGAEYGVYEVGVTILANKTNVLNYTVWMTRLDTAHTVTIPSPTTREMVITNPNLPGLELHLPAGTIIIDRYGKVVRQVGITAIPLDKPPFPLPGGVQVPLYFTVQPGGAYLRVQNAGAGPKGAWLIYPNAFHLSPGMGFDFWNYDADAKGWFIYGSGHVSPNGASVIPDPGVVIYELTGAMVGSGGAGEQGCMASWKNLWGLFCPRSGDPVSLTSGEFIYEKTDLVLPDTIPIHLTRTYRSNDSVSHGFGIGTVSPYDMFMVGDISPYTYQELILPDGSRVRFDRISSGTSYGDAVYAHVSADDPFYGARLLWTGGNVANPGPWQLTLRDGTSYFFPDSQGLTNANCQGLIGIRDRYGNQVRLDRSNHLANCNLNRITSPNGRSIAFTYNTQNQITQAQDNLGRTVNYTYDSAGRLSTVTDVGGGVTTYTYNDQNRMLTIKDARGIVYLTNQYDSSGRVIQQTNADGGTYLYSWTTSGNPVQSRVSAGVPVTNGSYLVSSGCWFASGIDSFNRYVPNCAQGYLPLMTQVDVTDPRGYIRRVVFNSFGYMTSDTHALGQPEQQTATYTYYSDNLVKSVTDTLGRTTSFDYDYVGNTTRVNRLDGTPNAVTSTMTYDGPFFQLSGVTDPLGNTGTLTYDGNGNLVQTGDPLKHNTTMTYNPDGRLASVTDPMNHVAQWGYFAGDLVSVIDPAGNTSNTYHDAVGRTLIATDPLGQAISMQYDPLNQITQVTDPAGNVSHYSYDANGNPLSLTDALGHVTSYTYDNMDRRATRTDPLLRQESYSYDLNGNLSSVTDRKGQVTAFTYDGLNRPTSACFGQTVNGGVISCASTTSYQYDLPNRRVIITDSLAGTTTRTFDDLGRLISEVTPQGSMSYIYDVAGRLITSTVAGQPQATYAYDTASRLTSITKGTQSVQFNYDNANRLTSMTLANGIVASYSYDAGNRLTGLTYTLGQTTIGNLTYAYDALNRRVAVGGSLAKTGLPGAMSSASYDAANQIANWNGTAFSYDADGNLLSDGSNSYAWDARGQLSGISGGTSASFAYDAFGRRIAKTIGASNTGFFYNGGAITQELSGSTVTANIWNGGTSYFQRNDANGSVVPLVDALGSVLALADANGNFTTQYTYDPFGGTTASGAASANPNQYIGQENDLTGLYYLHARYYSPALHRFISEDPLGFGAGDVNLHAYSLDSPSNFRDPSGKSVPLACAIGGGGNTALNWVADKLTGRKITLATSANYFISGCKTGVIMEITGINWAIGKLFSGLADVASSAAGKLFNEEVEAAAEATLGDAGEVCAVTCFPAGTPIMTQNGPVPIESIKVGDEVLSRNRQTGALEYKKVTALVHPHLSKLLEMRLAAEANPLQPTPEHPFFVRYAGGSQAEWIQASQIQVGDFVLTAAGAWTEVLAISPLEKEQLVYNFEVEENHDYFVGSTGLLVHNGDCGWLKAEEYLNGRYGGEPQVRFDTSIGPRTVDNLTSDGIAQESKYGVTDLTEIIERQIDKDVQLMTTPGSGVSSAEWHFFESPITGIGPTESLINALQEADIRIVLHLF